MSGCRNIIFAVATICLICGLLQADGIGGGMHGMKQRQNSDKSQQNKTQQPSKSEQQDSIDIQVQRLEKELGLNELQKIKLEKCASELKDNLSVIYSISHFEYGQFIASGSFDKKAFTAAAGKKTNLLSEVQGEFVEKLYSILDEEQKSKIKKMPLVLLWQDEKRQAALSQ